MERVFLDIEFVLCSNDDDYKKPISVGDLKYFLQLFLFCLKHLDPRLCTIISMFHHNQNFLLNNHKKPMWQNHNLAHKWNGVLHSRAHTHTKLIHICFWQNNNGNGNNCYFQAEITSWKNKLIYKHKYSKTSEGMIM